MDQSASVLAQHFVGAYRSHRQVSYNTINVNEAFRQHCETPLSVGLALDVHKNTRSKPLVEKLAGLELAVSYEKVMEIETGIANSVLEKMDSLGRLFLPPWLVKDVAGEGHLSQPPAHGSFTVPLMIRNRQRCSRPFVSKPFRVQEESNLQTGNNMWIKAHPCLHNTLWGLTDPTDKCRTTP